MDVLAEWPGLVKAIHVAVGDSVSGGDELVTLESMKMLTPVPAPGDGRVAEIMVQIEEYVDEGDALIRLH
jgi:biotin carboxyl carrier protein